MDLKTFLEDLFDYSVDIVLAHSIKPRLLPSSSEKPSMPRDCRIYLEDILDATRKVQAYTKGFPKTVFLQGDKTFDAVVRNLEIT